jgi:hypothetical protein
MNGIDTSLTGRELSKSTNDTSTTRELAAEFAAELTRVALAPLAKALGFYGDTAVAATATSIARRESGGLTDELERIIGESR